MKKLEPILEENRQEMLEEQHEENGKLESWVDITKGNWFSSNEIEKDYIISRTVNGKVEVIMAKQDITYEMK